MRYPRYAKAKEILPEDLMRQVQERFPQGGYLYFPSYKKSRRIARNLQIIRMVREGRTITEVAETYLLSRAAIRYILRATCGAEEERTDVGNCRSSG